MYELMIPRMGNDAHYGTFDTLTEAINEGEEVSQKYATQLSKANLPAEALPPFEVWQTYRFHLFGWFIELSRTVYKEDHS